MHVSALFSTLKNNTNLLESLDIRFSFLCRSTYQNEEGKSPIVLRAAFHGNRRDLFTGLYCLKLDWDSKQSKVLGKDAKEINRNLENILRKANNVFDSFRFSGEDFSIDELINKLKGKEDEPELLIEYLEKGNKSMLKRVGVEITKAAYYKYRRSLQYMQDFLLTNAK